MSAEILQTAVGSYVVLPIDSDGHPTEVAASTKTLAEAMSFCKDFGYNVIHWM